MNLSTNASGGQEKSASIATEVVSSFFWNTNRSEPASRTTDETEPAVSNRYKHDVAQAMAMRRRKPMKYKNQQSELTEDDVKLGLKGLDQADEYRKAGNFERALKLYELGLEVLIRYLKLPESTMRDWSLDKGMIQSRLEVAFNHAEIVKTTLQSAATATVKPSSPESAFQSLSNTLSRVLQTKPAVTTAQPRLQQPPVSRPKSSKPAASQSSRRKDATRQSVQASTRRPTAATSQTVQASAANTANNELRQTALTEFLIQPTDLQKTGWDDIAGLANVKQSLQESAILPLMRPDLFTGLRKPQNILLYGPPGTGKTMLVRAVAHESGSNLFVCTASALTSKWMGEAEKLVRVLFQVAREIAPSLIFLDEMDALLSSRKSDGEHEASRRLKTEFMVQMDGVTGHDDGRVLVLACTNCPWDVDSAVLRRFQRRLLVPLPDSEARNGLLKHLLTKTGKHNLTSRQVSGIVTRTDGFSCSDLASIAAEASFGPIRSLGGIKAISRVAAKDIRPVSSQDFDSALGKATKSVTQDLLAKYNEWQKEQSA